jgi:signal transduction histidine kinase
MAGGVAHDLGQSLALIAGYAELLERELAETSPDTRLLREYAAIMRSAAIDGGEMASAC